MTVVTKNIHTLTITGEEVLGFIREHKERVLELAPVITLTDIFQDGFNVFFKFNKEEFIKLLQEKEIVPGGTTLKDFRPQKNGGIQLDFE